jgi:hypothetical protein
MKAPKPFSKEEDDYIQQNYHSIFARDIAKSLKRSISGVRKRAGKLGLSKPLKRWISVEDEYIRKNRGKIELSDAALYLNRSISEISSRSKKLGFPKWRIPSGKHAGRTIDGFKDGAPVYTHRRIVEEDIGRSLTAEEIVHHIDMDKSNNNIENLFILSRSEHRKAHTTFENLVPELVKRKVIYFDKKTKSYYFVKQ